MYITQNNIFEPYVGKYVILDINGRKKKFLVQDIQPNTAYPASAYIFGNTFSFYGLAGSQDCETCENVVKLLDFEHPTEYELGDDLILSVTTAGNTALNYLWYKNGVQIVNPSSALEIPDFDTTDYGTYYVTVSSECNIQTSNTVVYGNGGVDPIIPSPSPEPTPSVDVSPSPEPTPSIIVPTPSVDPPSPSPSPSPTPSMDEPSPSPSPSPSVSPSPSPSVTPSPSSSPSPSPSSSVSPSPSMPPTPTPSMPPPTPSVPPPSPSVTPP